MKEKDIVNIAVAAVNALSGRYLSAATSLLKYFKAIAAVVITSVFGFIILISILISMPGITAQAALPDGIDENYNSLADFAQKDMSEAQVQKNSIIQTLLDALKGDSKDEPEIVGEIPEEELYILYAVKYGEYFDKSNMEQAKIDYITRNYFKISGLKLVVKSFDEVIDDIELNDEQKAVALNMYGSYMYDQYITGTDNDLAGIKDYGNVIFRDGGVTVVYYNQRDKRWSSLPYGDSTVGHAGCGPTSLAMAVSTFTDKKITPEEMCRWAYENNYKAKGGGSYWSFIPNGAKDFELEVSGNIKKSQEIVDALSEGKLVIAIMGKGHFTSSGHFLVLRGVTSEGKVLVADPASEKRTYQEWDLDVIMSEVKHGSDAGGPFWIVSE